MTNQAPNTRKVVQQIKSAGEQNERMLVRSITTILASVGTLVGWMALAAQTPVAVVAVVVEETPAPTEVPAAPVVIDALIPTATVAFAPIPTLRAIPGRQILPTLMPTLSGAAVAGGAVDAPADPNVFAPTVAAQTLRVVVVPTAAAVEAPGSGSSGGTNQPIPTVAANQPQPTAVPNAPKPTAVPKPKPTPAGNSKGSK